MQVNDVSQSLAALIHHAYVPADRHVAMIRWRRWQLAREITRHGVNTFAEVWIERPARLETRFLVGREPILGSEAHWRMALVLLVPSVRRLTRVVIELHGRLAILIPSIGWSRLCLDGRRRRQ
jgi:hypothetical protein